jgi:hypothetical protein
MVNVIPAQFWLEMLKCKRPVGNLGIKMDLKDVWWEGMD